MKTKPLLLLFTFIFTISFACNSEADYYTAKGRVDVKAKPDPFSRTTMILPFGSKLKAKSIGARAKYKGKEGEFLHCEGCGGYVFNTELTEQEPTGKGRLKLFAQIDPAAKNKEEQKLIVLMRGDQVRIQKPFEKKELSGRFQYSTVGMKMDLTTCTSSEGNKNCLVKPEEKKATLLFNRRAGNFFMDHGGQTRILFPKR